MLTDAMLRYQRGLTVLESGDPAALEGLSSELVGFPHGEDPYVGRRWITNGIISDVAVVWAKVEQDGKDVIRGFLVEKERQAGAGQHDRYTEFGEPIQSRVYVWRAG